MARKRSLTFYKAHITSGICYLMVFVMNSLVLNFFVEIHIIIRYEESLYIDSFVKHS